MKKILLYTAIALLALLSSCSTKKNTRGSRFWHSFTARYNTYYNGSEAYKEGCIAKENGNKDNYTELIPFFTVGNEASRTLGGGNFETAITKCEKAIQLHSIKRRPVVSASKKRTDKLKAYLNRKEFNPFLKHAWLLMGKAQFQRGEFLEAASTFSYITRLYAPEPEVVAEARTWLTRCYSELEWFYDAEDVLDKMQRDTIPARLKTENAATYANLYLRQGQLAEALPHLELAAKKEKCKLQKARLYFLLGQVHKELGNNDASYKAFAKCIKQSPPYEMSFNARILQTEALSEGKNAKKMISKLRRMARSDNNKDFLDQVYYAMGNIHMSQGDTASAVSAYEKGREKSTRNAIEKGVLLLRLGEIYWDLQEYDKAQKCYTEAIGLIDKNREDYKEIERRSKVLDELVPFTSAIHLQDSLQALALMSEEDRNAAIDRVIKALIEKEKAEAKARADSAAEARAQENGGNMGGAANNRQPSLSNQQQGDNKAWYFYNPTLVMQGKQDFQKQWGRRKNEDNWRRSNRSVLAVENFEGYDYEAEDSLAAAQAIADSIAAAESETEVSDSLVNDPHQREYYLQQIPFTPEAKASSDEIIMDGLYNAGIIEKDKLGDFPLAEKTLTRLYTQYPSFEKLCDVYYQLFLLYSRWQQPERANEFRQMMQAQFPESDTTRIISDPQFEYYARYGKEIEDSLYTATYAAYRARNNEEVAANFAFASDKFPTGLNRPKFIFVNALSRLGSADPKELAAELRSLVEKYPESDVSEMAGMIVKGLESGREIGTGEFDLGAIWSRRSADTEKGISESTQQKELSAERNTPFFFVIAYPNDSINDNQLLYDMAHFNFTGFMARGFDLSIQKNGGITQFRIGGFNNFEESHAYAQKIFADTLLSQRLKPARVLLISEENLELLGTLFSYDDYKAFYDQHFAPMEINPELPVVFEEEVIEQRYEDEFSPEELEQMEADKEEESSGSDDGEWFSE